MNSPTVLYIYLFLLLVMSSVNAQDQPNSLEVTITAKNALPGVQISAKSKDSQIRVQTKVPRNATQSVPASSQPVIVDDKKDTIITISVEP